MNSTAYCSMTAHNTRTSIYRTVYYSTKTANSLVHPPKQPVSATLFTCPPFPFTCQLSVQYSYFLSLALTKSSAFRNFQKSRLVFWRPRHCVPTLSTVIFLSLALTITSAFRIFQKLRLVFWRPRHCVNHTTVK